TPVPQRLLAAATRLFAEQGYDRTSVQEIVEAAGVTKGALYHYFGSKDDLLHEVYARVLRVQQERLDAYADADEPIEKRLRGAAADVVVTTIENLDDASIFFRSMHHLSPEKNKQVRAARRRYHERFRALIEEGQEAGVFSRATPADLVVDYHFGSVHHLSTWYRPDGPLSPQEVADHLADLLLRALRPCRARRPAPTHQRRDRLPGRRGSWRVPPGLPPAGLVVGRGVCPVPAVVGWALPPGPCRVPSARAASGRPFVVGRGVRSVARRQWPCAVARCLSCSVGPSRLRQGAPVCRSFRRRPPVMSRPPLPPAGRPCRPGCPPGARRRPGCSPGACRCPARPGCPRQGASRHRGVHTAPAVVGRALSPGACRVRRARAASGRVLPVGRGVSAAPAAVHGASAPGTRRVPPARGRQVVEQCGRRRVAWALPAARQDDRAP